MEQEALGVLKQNGVTVVETRPRCFRKRVAAQTENFMKARPEAKPIIELIRSTSVSGLDA